MEPVLPFAPDLGAAAGHLVNALHQQLRAAILDGRLVAGAELPSSRALAAELGVARNTVVSAYDLLVAEGYVLPRRGAKATVADLRGRIARRTDATVPIEDPRLAPFWRAPSVSLMPARELPERSFRLGVGDHRHFPHALWRRLMAQALRSFAKQRFEYPPSEGLPPLRTAIAQHVAFARAVACTADDVIVTSGAQQAFDLLARLLVRPGQTRVAVENPGYPPLRMAFAAVGAELVPVPVDDEGLCVECIPRDVDIVLVTPSHQSPTGAALSLRRRMALLDFARARNAVIVEDDYDGEFRFSGRPLDALQTLDRDGTVFYVGTFSKTLFPALRKGFIVAPRWARAPLAQVKACVDAHADAVTQSVLAAFIREGHMARHVRRMRAVYATRRVALLSGFAKMSRWLDPIPSEAGMHTAARLRDPEDAARFLRLMREHAPGAQAVAEYAVAPLPAPAVVFGYGVIDAEEITTRLVALRRALARQASGRARSTAAADQSRE
jgi:GntR family transcriptional regulator/MocR family aminotransferase